ncbi:MAG: PAS domain S-box protein [Candidatus Rokubacteria bacterium]|nr:PAS domain S-box protein [Candidatus Rokubacteria bacterium]
MNWHADTSVAGILLGYLVFLFLVAAVAERFAARLQTAPLRTVTYVLAISVYCTAWTFYGSVGLAANRGLEFLTIYLGPALIALTWPFLLRKLVRVAKEQRITTISDFIASRYGKSSSLGTLVAVLVVCGMIPYIALQLKAVSVSFRMMIGPDSILSEFDPTLLVAVTLALFGILFGARNLDFTKHQTGLMTAVAVESIVKLVAFVLVGGFVTWGLFDGFSGIFARIAEQPQWSHLLRLDAPPAASYVRWAAMLVISMMAVMLLPRQFHVLVVQNPRERDVATAAWAFPLYLLAINVFVLPIALGGLLLFGGDASFADSFILALPLHADAGFVAVAVFIGGFSAATAMIVVDSLALSKMISNDIILPFILRRRGIAEVYWATLNSTRLGILVVVTLGYMWARMEAGQLLLVEMGLLSFIAVTQCAPAALIGLYWRRGNRRGATVGISLGFALWFYTLIIPALGREGVVPAWLLERGPFGLEWLRPIALFGLEGFDTLSHGVFWTLFFNVGAYVLVSILTSQDADERSQAAAFVGGAAAEPSGTPAILSVSEIERLIHLYLPAGEADAILHALLDGKAPRELTVPDLLELRIRLERVLTASLGAAAARYIIEDRFTISKDEAGQLVESFQGMQRSLRKSERLLASVVESVDDCIFTTDVEGRVITLNPAGRRLLGRADAGAPRLTSLDVLTEADRRRVGPAIERAVGAGRAWRGSVTAVTSDGRQFPAHLAVSCVFDAQRNVLGTVGVLRDLTELVATQQRLIQREKLASLGEMAAGVAHEIRNPLGGIKMATRLLASGEVGGDRISREMAESIVSGIAEIETIIADLLDYARDTRLDCQEYPLARILAPVVETAADEARRRGVDVVARGLDLDVVANVDGPRLRQMVANVLNNAVEAAERRSGARVEVTLHARAMAAVVEVRDNGTGMRQEEREKIFLPFFTTKPTGTGLGMAIVKKLMDLHGGEIEIESTPGRGTVVRLVIPRAAAAAPVKV